MAIPKEPRQLMINIMYLVLTAMLALNVSAEIFNAFRVLDDGIVKSNNTLDKLNDRLPDEIAKLARKDETLRTYAERTQPVNQLSRNFSSYIDGVIDTLIGASGGYLPNGKLKGYKNKDVTTRLLVNDGMGDELKSKYLGLREQFLQYVDPEDRNTVISEIAINLDTVSWVEDDLKKKKRARSWSNFTFNHMPVQATLPILSKLKNDVKSTEAAVLGYLSNKVGGEDIKLDRFQVVAVPKKSYIIKGETYEADIFLSASAGGSSNTDIRISAGGSPLTVEDGVAKYSARGSSTGIKTYSASIAVTNPVTGETNTYDGTFEYEVGERSVSVSADKMNVMYIGVDNPLSITAAGISSNDMRVSGSGGGIQINRTSNGKYNAKVSSQGTATVTVSGGGLSPTNYEFRTKWIPKPVPQLSGNTGGDIKNGVFRAQRGIIPVLENFDFDAKCNIVGFRVVKIPPTGDAIRITNGGQSFTTEAKNLVQQAKPGDSYLFENIRCKCPGWTAAQRLSPLLFRIE